MGKLDLRKKLSERTGKKVKHSDYRIAMLIMKTFLLGKMNCHVEYKCDISNIDGPFIIISNHTSRCDYLYISKAFEKYDLNYMVSYTEFYRAHMHGVFDWLHMVPKKNFISDVHSIRELSQIIDEGGRVVLFPEGKSSISGTNQPTMPGTGKLLKHTKVPVYVCNIKGGYMSNTQWNIANRPGKVVITIDQLLSVEDCEKYSTEEIDSMIQKAIWNDDFIWNRENHIKYKGNNTVCNKLEEHLFWCPKCGKELTMEGTGNKFKCKECGNGVTVNEYYELIPDNDTCVVPKDLRVWYELQRRKLYREIKNNENFEISEEVEFGILPNDHYVPKTATSEIVGKGKLILNRKELSYIGTKNGENFELHMSTLLVPSLLFETDSSYFGTFYDGEYYEFHPKRKVSTKFVIACEECHRINGGKWINNIPEQQWIYEDDKEEDKEKYYL